MLATSCTSSSATLGSVVQDVIARGPQRGDDYAPPAPAERAAVAHAVSDLAHGKTTPPPQGWKVVDVTAEGESFRALLEAGSGRLHGYGVYVARGTGSRILLEVPHPRYDQHTEDLGLAVFPASQADVLLVAGAHRTAGHDAADVAHETNSAFAAVNAALVSRGDLVLQLHGFAEAKHKLDVDAVVSSTTEHQTAPAKRLAKALRDAGWRVCVYGDPDCTGLGGTTNVEASAARDAGADFLHLELSDSIRDSAQQRDRLAKVLIDFLKDERQRRS
ncbi:MAG: hypothetical protein ACTHK1_10745 [Actinomycetales bacterium]